ncbi:hypothetical protein, partial [Flavobacterium sp.]|uniref:Ig-like domain-containing protein n=1 Tax=Flavobacterium sp. TaxID=239 RepID=UPI0038D03834
MRISKFLTFSLLFLLFFSSKATAQCFSIESILVDACSPNLPVNEEGYNEMVRFKVGSAAINLTTTPLNVNWPNVANPWLGLIQNATTASKVAALNAAITSAGSCGIILEPTGGVLPANAEVILVTSQNINTSFNSFSSLAGTIYMIFQNNPSNTGGNFANWNVVAGIRTLTMSFGSCTQSVSYDRSLLINIFGAYGGLPTDNDGATVNFTSTGVASYVNNGCIAPIPPFLVNAGASQTACKGSTISLSGTAQGQQSVSWSAPSGTFSAPTSLNTNYTIDPTTPGNSITLTLSITNSCNIVKTSTVVINLTSISSPTVTTPVSYCQNVTALPLSATATSGGVLNWYGTNATGGTASTTVPTPSTSTLGTTTYYVSQTIAGCESVRVPIFVSIANTGPALNLHCDPANSTQTSLYFQFDNVGQTDFSYFYSIDGGPVVSGTWVSPNHFIVSGLTIGQSVVFNLIPNGVSCISSETTICNTACTSITAPNFAAISPICYNGSVPVLATISPNGISGTWSPSVINPTAIGTTSYVFTPDSIAFPCASQQTLTVTINSNPIVTVNNPSVCQGIPANVIATPTTTGTYSYSWTVPAGVTNPGNSSTLSTSIAGSYSVIITDSVTGCASSSASGIVSVNSNPVVSVNSPSVCQGTPATVSATPTSSTSATFSYSWTVPAGFINPGNVSNFNTSTTGVYSVVITDIATGCSSSSATGAVSVNSNPIVLVNSPSVCQGIPATVTANPSSVGSYSYAWIVPSGATNPGNVPSFSTSTAGIYSIIITDLLTGCSSSSVSGVVTSNANPILTVNSPTVCQGNPATVFATAATAANYSYVWTVPSGASNPG